METKQQQKHVYLKYSSRSHSEAKSQQQQQQCYNYLGCYCFYCCFCCCCICFLSNQFLFAYRNCFDGQCRGGQTVSRSLIVAAPWNDCFQWLQLTSKFAIHFNFDIEFEYFGIKFSVFSSLDFECKQLVFFWHQLKTKFEIISILDIDGYILGAMKLKKIH